MIAIVGASGNTGSIAAERLLTAGERVRAIGRNTSHLERLRSLGAEIFTADVTDAAGMTKAFEGASAVYAMVPPNFSAPDFQAYQAKVSESLASAIRKAAVPKVVVLSSIGADKPGNTGPVTGLHRLEERLNKVGGFDAVYLRAGYFMENILPQVAVIRNFGMMAGPVRADLPLPMIATRDIGAAAAQLLLKPEFTGKLARELQGERDVSYAEVASIVGKAVGKPGLSYTQLPPEQLRPAMAQFGMSDSVVNLLLEMAEALNSGYMVALESRTKRNSNPTSIEAFVNEEFVPRFQSA